MFKKLKKNKKRFAGYRGIGNTHWVLLFLVFVSGSLLLSNENVQPFMTTVIPVNNPAPYNGTTLPVLKVPKWTALSSSEWDLSYDQIPADKMIAIPLYDANKLKTPTEQLGWQSVEDLNIRNAKITFSIPYMGNYELDGIENAGSHLAVDIKVPNDTPVYAIGNGVVSKVSEQSTGFGNHIVITHDNFPSFANPSVKEDYFSSYSHLGKVLVSEGALVTKGQLIGKSGKTGTATTPHVHFQIDNTSAPWHPYWPFTYQESNEAGLSFTEAVNAGLGKDKAIKTTINPMVYVQKYMSGSQEAVSADTSVTVPSQPVNTIPSNDNTVTPTTETDKIYDESYDIPPLVQPDADSTENETPIEEDIAPENLTDNSTDVAEPDEPAEIVLFKDVTASSEYFGAINFLKDYGVINGYPDGTFKPNGIVSRVEALKFILSGSGDNLTSANSLPFSDTSVNEWYADYIATAYNRQIVDGYPDNSFKPASTVNKAEFIKMLLLAMDADIDMNITKDVYSDVPRDAWFAPYVQYAKERNLLVIKNNEFRPNEGMTRAEVSELLYRAVLLEVSGSKKYSSGIKVSEVNLSEYFS